MPASSLTDIRRDAASLEVAAPELVTPPALERRLPIRGGAVPHQRNLPSSACYLLAAHGGAGVTSLLRAGVPGSDADGAWPPDGQVVVVARRTAYGLEWARDAARQHASGYTPADLILAGLVVVADAPGRAPTRITDFLDLVAGAYPRVWEIPWVEEWRLAGHAEPLPTPPAVRQLNDDMQALAGAATARDKE